MNTISIVRRFRGDYEFLSNFYPAKLRYDGIDYYHAEAAYQAQKCADFAQREQFAKLYSDESKRFGRNIVVRQDWDEIKVSVMEQVVRAKFEQNPILAQLLLATGEMELQEGNTWHDVFWGVDLKTDEGENHLGKILMALREDFRENGIMDRSKERPIEEYHIGQHLIITDEALADVQAMCVVKETEDKLLIPGQAQLQKLEELQSILVGAPVYMKDDEHYLGDCYINSLNLAKECGVKSIAFPVISVGRRSFPKQKAAQLTATAVMKWLAENPEADITVYLVPEDIRTFHFLVEETKAIL